MLRHEIYFLVVDTDCHRYGEIWRKKYESLHFIQDDECTYQTILCGKGRLMDSRLTVKVALRASGNDKICIQSPLTMTKCSNELLNLDQDDEYTYQVCVIRQGDDVAEKNEKLSSLPECQNLKCDDH